MQLKNKTVITFIALLFFLLALFFFTALGNHTTLKGHMVIKPENSVHKDSGSKPENSYYYCIKAGNLVYTRQQLQQMIDNKTLAKTILQDAYIEILYYGPQQLTIPQFGYIPDDSLEAIEALLSSSKRNPSARADLFVLNHGSSYFSQYPDAFIRITITMSTEITASPVSPTNSHASLTKKSAATSSLTHTSIPFPNGQSSNKSNIAEIVLLPSIGLAVLFFTAILVPDFRVLLWYRHKYKSFK